MRKYYFLLLFLQISTLSFGQYKNYNALNQIWHKGKIGLLDGNVLKGSINYNFVSETLKLKVGDEDVIYSPEKVLYFEYNDEDQIVKYYVLPYKGESRDREVPTYFRVMKESDQVVLLSKRTFTYHKNLSENQDINSNSIFSKNKARDNDGMLGTDRETVFEVLYLANTNGIILPYMKAKVRVTHEFKLIDKGKLKYNEKELSEKQLNKERNRQYKYLNKDALQIALDTEFNRFKKIVKKEKLNLRDKSDLLKAFDIYINSK